MSYVTRFLSGSLPIIGDDPGSRSATQGVTHYLVGAFVAALLVLGLGQPASAARVVVNADDWTTHDSNFTASAERFTVNVFTWLTRSAPDPQILIDDQFDSSNPNYNLMLSALGAAGFTVVRAHTSTWTSDFVATFDAVLIELGTVDANLLRDYVLSGGGVYVVAGFTPSNTFHNGFLANFNLSISPPTQGGFSVTQFVAHPVTDGVTELRTVGPTSLNVTGPGPSIVSTQYGINFLAVWEGDIDADGLSTSWEIQFGLDEESGVGDDGTAGDPDGDGKTNLEEFQAGTHPRGTFIRYLAEGATGNFFDTQIALANPGGAALAVLLRFLRSDGQVFTHFVSIGATTRATVDPTLVAAGLQADAFSVIVEADGVVAVDRTMRWDGTRYGSHAETGIPAPSPIWYLAEGSTVGPFDLFYLFQNPGDTTAQVRVKFLLPSDPPVIRTYLVGATARFNIWVNLIPELAETDVSAVIEVISGPNIIVERAMYLTGTQTFQAGHASAGVTAPSTEWFLAEGATGAFFDEFLLLANPGMTDALVTATYLLPDGSTVAKNYGVPAQARRTVWVDLEDPLLASTSVSVTVLSTNEVPIVVERAMWWPGPSAATWTGAHNSAGSTATATRWVLAEGEVAGPLGGPTALDTFILLANTSITSGTVRVTLLFEDGTTAVRDFPINASSRSNVWVRSDFPAAVGRRFGALVESLGGTPAALVVERAMYRNSGSVMWAAGTNALAMPLP